MLINWLLYPLLLTLASAGHGLLVRRIARGPSNLLLLPTGFALMIAVTTLLMASGLHRIAWLGIVVPAVLGLLLGRGELRAWRAAPRTDWIWPAAAAVGAFAIFAMPVVLSGRLTFTGFSMITDIANHFDLTARIVSSGHVVPNPVDSSFAESLRKLFGANYPSGLHSLLGSWSELLGRELAWMYQPTIAFAAPMGALAAFGVLRWTGLPLALRALGALIVVQPTLLYSYGLVAGFKELFAAVMILTAVALLIEAFEAPDRRLLVLALPVIAGYDSFSLAIAPWLGLVLGVFAIAAVLRTQRIARHLTLARVVSGAAVLLALALLILPSFSLSEGSLSSQPGVAEVVTSETDLGNLAAPLDPLTSVGVWLTGDYRFPLAINVGLTHALIYLVLALAALGLLSVLWKRRPEIAAVAVAAGLTLLVILPQTGPWVDAKIYAITGTLVLALAFFGVGALAERRRTLPLAWVLGLVVGGGVLYGNALAVHSASLAPERRLSELERIGHRFAGQGPALAPSFDEYAEYFLRDLKTVGRVNPPAGLPGDAPQFGADLDQISYDFVKTFPLIVLRRNPTRSRPPSNYVLAERTRFYDVWRHVDGRPQIFDHIPLAGLRSARSNAYCKSLATRLAATSNGDHLVWALARSPAAWVPSEGSVSPNWPPDPAVGGVRTHGPGRADGFILLQRSGRYELWQTGSFERPVQLKIDGRRVGTLEGLSDYPAEAVYVTTINLTKGVHAVQARRGGGNLRPGNGDATLSRYVGPLFFERSDDPGGRTFTTPVGKAKSICESRRPLDWVELLGSSTP